VPGEKKLPWEEAYRGKDVRETRYVGSWGGGKFLEGKSVAEREKKTIGGGQCTLRVDQLRFVVQKEKRIDTAECGETSQQRRTGIDLSGHGKVNF